MPLALLIGVIDVLRILVSWPGIPSRLTRRDGHMIHVLAVVRDSEQGARLERLLRASAVAYRLASEITAASISFAHRLADVVVIVGDDDPLSRLAYLRLAGVDLPIIVFDDRPRREWGAYLLAGGAAACARVPRTAAAMLSILDSATDSRPHASERTQQDFTLDPVGLTVCSRGSAVQLTRREYALLHALVSRAGAPVSTARLQTHAWGDALPQRSASQIVTVYVHLLRRKLGAIGLPETIVTIRNYGYSFLSSAQRSARKRMPPTAGTAPSSAHGTARR